MGGNALKTKPAELVKFGRRLARRRRDCCISQAQLAEKIGVSFNLVNNLERGQNWPSMPVYIAICRVLEIKSPPLL